MMQSLRVFSFLCLLLVMPAVAFGVTVAEVRVENRGPGEIDKDFILAHISLKEGDPYSPGAVARDVRALHDTGRIAYVSTEVEQIGPEDIAVIYVIETKARIRSIRIEGADQVGNRRIRNLLELGVGDLVDESILAVRAKEVKEHYRKRYFIDPSLSWSIDVDAETGLADVRITVDEGPRAGVFRIRFEGNEAISSRQLRRNMRQGSWRPWSWITKGNLYDPNDLAMDRETLRIMYMNEGYLDVRVGEPQVDDHGGRRVNVTIPIEEGPLYRIDSVEIRGVTLFSVEDVERAIRIQSGDAASLSSVEASRQAIQDYFGSRGYYRTAVNERLLPHADEAVVDVVYEVREGELAHIRDIRISGNTRTQDKVIRRELAIYPGDIFDQVRVRRSEMRLRNMGYFDMVRASPEPTMREAGEYDLVFEVDEARTGQLMAGAGFSSIDNVIGFVEIAQNNFDLLGWPYFTGGGQRARIRTQIGSRRSDVDISFVEPWFLDRQLSLEVDLFRSDKRFLSREFDQLDMGGRIGLSRALGTHNRVRISYGFEEITIRNISDDASDIIRAEEGRRNKSSVTLSLIHDSRDSFFIPTRGNRSSLSFMVAGGPLQGDTDIYSMEARTSQFFPLWFNHVFSIRGSAATVDRYGDSDRVPIFDRLFMGGPRNVRGFRFRDVGPKDQFGEPVGGRTSAFLSAEYTVPVVQNIRLATFYDIGMVWEDAYEIDLSNLNSAAGIGIRFDIPGFPLRFDYAWPIEHDEFNRRTSGRFSFMIGHVF